MKNKQILKSTHMGCSTKANQKSQSVSLRALKLLLKQKKSHSISSLENMKTSKPRFRYVLTAFLFISFLISLNAATFTSVQNGPWNSSSTWDRNGTPDVDNWPNDKVIIKHTVTATNITMNGSSSRITIQNGGTLSLSHTLNVGSGQVHVNSGGTLSGNKIYLNTSNTCTMNGTITSTSHMDLDGHMIGSPTIVVGGRLLAGSQNKNILFSNLDLLVASYMTVNNVQFRWTSGSVTVGGNFKLTGTGDVDVPNNGTLDVGGTLEVSHLNSIDGPTGSGSGGVVSWGVGSVVLSGNNLGLNNCPKPYNSPFDLSTCSQSVANDVTAPIITLLGSASVSHTAGDSYTDAGATATDDTDGDVTSSISTSNNVDVNTPGTYQVTYNVSDAAGNAATQMVRTVTVSDLTAPVITLTGSSNLDLNVGGTYTELGATAVDNIDGDVTSSISISNNVDVNTPGTYQVTYNVSDAAGNTATQVVRTVEVLDVTPPVITITGSSTLSLDVGDTYIELGATATDDTDGDLTSNISIINNVDVNIAGTYSVTYTVSDAAGNEASETRQVVVTIPTRTSVQDGSFDATTTWDCGCVPSTGADVVVAHDLTLESTYTVGSANSFTVNSGKTLSFSSYISVEGEFTNNGTLNDGDLRFTGTGNQSPVIGSTLENLEINNPAGVTLQGDITLKGELILNSGILSLNGYTLQMDATNSSTPLISQQTCSNYVDGDITLSQYVPEAAYGHHYLSTPMSSMSLLAWEDNFDFKLTSYFPHLYYYDEPNEDWETPTASTDDIVVGRGYTGYFTGERIVDMTGDVNCGDIDIPITADGDGWNLIGNPYPSPINWDNVSIPEGMSGATYRWDHIPAIWGRYATYIDGVGVNGGTSVIPLMQGFFVHSEASTTLQLQNSARVQDKNNSVGFLSEIEEVVPSFRLSVSGFSNVVEVLVRFKEFSSSAYEINTDALLFPSGGINGMDMATISNDGEKLVINTMSKNDLYNEIPLYIKVPQDGIYTIDQDAFDNLSSTSELILFDKFTGRTHHLESGPYVFNSEETDSKDRFTLMLKEITLNVNEIKTSLAEIIKMGGKYTLKLNDASQTSSLINIFNIQGQIVKSITLNEGTNFYELPSMDPSLYFLKVFHQSGFEQIKWINK